MREASSTSGKPGLSAVANPSDIEGVQITFTYPRWVNIPLFLFGIIAFVSVGFWGYDDAEAIHPGRFYEPPLFHDLFRLPWPLLLWFFALILLLLIAGFHGVEHRGKLLVSSAATVVMIVIAGAIIFDRQLVSQMLDALVRLLDATSGQALVYTLIDLGVILLYGVYAVWGWIRHAKAAAGTTTRGQAHPSADDETSWTEMAAGDFITTAILCLILAGMFKLISMLFLSGLGSVVQPISALNLDASTCALSWPIGKCHVGAPNNPPTLGVIDLWLMIIVFTLGVLLLCIVVFPLILPGGRPPQEVADWEENAQIAVSGAERALLRPMKRIFHDILRNLAWVARNVLWPPLIVLSIGCAVGAAYSIQQYLHLQSDFRTCTTSLCSVYPQLVALGVSIALCGSGTLCIVGAAAILHRSWAWMKKSLGVLAGLGFNILLFFWMPSLVLSGVNASLLWVFNVSGRVPFPQPGASTAVSFAVFLSYRIWLWRRGGRGGRGGRWGNVSAAPK